jgi:hypothetical protein
MMKDMDSIAIAEKDDLIDKIYDLIRKIEGKDKSQVEEAIKLLGKAYSLYDSLLQEKGKAYCKEHCPDAISKMKGLVNKLNEYNN